MTPLTNRQNAVIRRVVEQYTAGGACAEVLFTNLAQHFDPAFQPALRRMATAFNEGLAQNADMCGALAGGLLLISYLHGRTSPDADGTACGRYAREFRTRFVSELGSTSCFHFTHGIYSDDTRRRCGAIVARAATLLFELLPPPDAGS